MLLQEALCPTPSWAIRPILQAQNTPKSAQTGRGRGRFQEAPWDVRGLPVGRRAAAVSA